MIRHSLKVLALASLALPTLATAANPTKEDAQKLVEETVVAVQKDAPGTFKKIMAGEAPFKNAQMPELYAFVYDHSITMIAHPDKALVGRDLNNKADACGCLFRNEIVNRVKGTTSPTKCKAGTSKDWVNYAYKNPEKKTLEKKTTYFKNVKGSDGKEYIVLSGIYLEPLKGCE